MTARLKLLTVSVLLVVSACVSAGTQAITDAGVVSQIEVGKSTRAEVAALLGYPITASYGDQGEETLALHLDNHLPQAHRVCARGQGRHPLFGETTRALAVTFSPGGTVKSLGLNEPPSSPGPSG